ncbi:MAG: MoxR family ATPase [Clostridiales bacterium]|nr:MoxR family ATPase [Clostridiales bacterium]
MNLNISSITEKIQRETEKIIIGKPRQIRLIVMALLAGGHVLLDDLPGLGKTTLIKTLAIVLGCDFKRIQFVPDLLPSDIMGMKIYNQKSGEFQLAQGPIMTNIVLADEVNRAIPRTQAALLEAMEEKQVTIDGQTFPLPSPFMVMATQNPVESDSSFNLPAGQMDRFLIRLSLGYLGHDEEREMLERLGDGTPFESVENVTDAAEITAMQEDIKSVHLSRPVADYIVSLTQKTREHPSLKMGAGPRASRSLYKAAKVLAAMSGREFVIPDDVQEILQPVLAHRLILTNEARLSGKTASQIVEEAQKRVPVPPGREELFRE